MHTKQSTALHPYLVALLTATGAVTFLVTRHPAAQLEHLGTELAVERSAVMTTPHAQRIADELRQEFADKALAAWGAQPYFLVDWEEVERAIAEFDLATGWRLRLGDVAVGDQVQVELSTADQPGKKMRGEITAISGARFLVRLNDAVGALTGCWAPRASIKPIKRTCAIAGMA